MPPPSTPHTTRARGDRTARAQIPRRGDFFAGAVTRRALRTRPSSAATSCVCTAFRGKDWRGHARTPPAKSRLFARRFCACAFCAAMFMASGGAPGGGGAKQRPARPRAVGVPVRRPPRPECARRPDLRHLQSAYRSGPRLCTLRQVRRRLVCDRSRAAAAAAEVARQKTWRRKKSVVLGGVADWRSDDPGAGGCPPTPPPERRSRLRRRRRLGYL